MGRVRLKSKRAAFSISAAREGGAWEREKVVAAARREGSWWGLRNVGRDTLGRERWGWGLILGAEGGLEAVIRALEEAMIMLAMAAMLQASANSKILD